MGFDVLADLEPLCDHVTVPPVCRKLYNQVLQGRDTEYNPALVAALVATQHRRTLAVMEHTRRGEGNTMFSRVPDISGAPRAVDLDLIGKMLDTAEGIYGDPVLAAAPDMFAFAGRLIDSAQARYDAWLASESWKCEV